MLFGIPGSGASLTLLDLLERKDIPFYLTHFEGSAALMAATVGHLSGKAGVSISIKGPGLTNSMSGIAAAWFENFPLVHIAESSPPDAPASLAHKRLDQASLVSTVTKASRHFGFAGGFSALARHALAEAPGPVVYNLTPKPIDGEPDLISETLVSVNEEVGLDLIRKSRRPLVIAGSAALRAGLSHMLSGLGFPVFSTAAAKGIVDETAANAAGVFTGVGLSLTPEAVLVTEADLVIGIGLTAKEVLAVKPFPLPFVAFDAALSIGSEGFAPVSSIRLTVDKVGTALTGLPGWGLQSLQTVKRKLDERMSDGFLPGTVFQHIQSVLPLSRVVMDTGYFCTIGEHAWKASRADLCLMSGQGRYMGTSLPMALGAALYDQATPTICVVGDGGVGMYLAEARLAARYRLPMIIMLMTDGTFGSIRTRSIRDGITQKPLLMEDRSWIPSFEALGIPGIRTATLEELDSALRTWDASCGPVFIEVPFDPDPYEAMVRDIR
jgi:acetolactate synthase-1/2/3 large subunit